MTNNNDKTIVAIMYDFDNTLSTKDMQEFDFLPKIDYYLSGEKILFSFVFVLRQT